MAPISRWMDVFYRVHENSLRLVKLLWGKIRLLVLVYFATLIMLAIIPFVKSALFGLAVNETVTSTGTFFGVGKHYAALGGMLFCAALAPLFQAFQQYARKMLRFSLEKNITDILMRKRSELDMATHENPAQNDVYVRVHENHWRIQNFLERYLYFSQDLLEVVIASIILIGIDWRVGFLVMIGTMPELIVGIRYGRDAWGIYDGKAEVRRRYYDATGRFNHLPDLIEMKLYETQNYFRELAIGLLESFQIREKQTERRKLGLQSISVIIGYLTLGVSILWFFQGVVSGAIKIGTFIFIMTSIEQFGRSMSGLFRNLGSQFEDNLFVSDFFDWLAYEPRVRLSEKPVLLRKSEPPEIVFDSVTFGYQGCDKSLFHNLSLCIQPGEKIALVGENGAGKTTLVKLLCRFYDPQEGRILINGVNLRDLDIRIWHDQLGVLFQEYAHYYMQVHEAIRIGRIAGPHSERMIKRAAERSHSHEFIKKWEKEYNTQLGNQFEGGKEPSIGQWQKLALARVFYRNPKVLILDEPTASIDPEAERKIFEDLEASINNQTVIMISHRFGSVRGADTIYVLKDGGILESGNHDALMKKNTRYAELFRFQAERYK